MKKTFHLSLAAMVLSTQLQALEFIENPKHKVVKSTLPIYYPKLDNFRYELNRVIDEMKTAGNANYIFDRTSQLMRTWDFWWYNKKKDYYPMCSKTHNVVGGVRYEVFNKAYGIDPRDPKYHTYNQAPFKPFKIDYNHYAPTNIDFAFLLDNQLRLTKFSFETGKISDRYNSGEYGAGDIDHWGIMCDTSTRLFEINWYLGNYPNTHEMYLDSVAWQFKNRPYENFLKGDRIIKIVHPLTKRVIFDAKKIGRITLDSNLLDMLAQDPDIRSMELLDYYVERQVNNSSRKKIVKIYNVRNIYPVMTYDDRGYTMNYNQVRAINTRMAFIRMKYLVEAGILQFRRPIPKAELDVWFDENPEYIKDANYQFSPNYQRQYQYEYDVKRRYETKLDDSKDLPDSVYQEVGEGKYYRYYEEKGLVVYFKPFGKTEKQIEKSKAYQQQLDKWRKEGYNYTIPYSESWFQPGKTKTTNTKDSTIETYYLNSGKKVVVEISCKVRGVQYPKEDPHCYKLVKPTIPLMYAWEIKNMKKACKSLTPKLYRSDKWEYERNKEECEKLTKHYQEYKLSRNKKTKKVYGTENKNFQVKQTEYKEIIHDHNQNSIMLGTDPQYDDRDPCKDNQCKTHDKGVLANDRKRTFFYEYTDRW
ncbi:hypothetical protein HMPREF1430_00301 [Helicobacter pylori GAM96Ai]|uniref:hypothetical protein n=1 Tax=Helicobacter pylori TaxID=210 RepID=UPI0002BA324A|nr:hypothetical protein [Helicobacter pylori]EMH44713.1 hypothetical protein HMPREF1430_00301 [Helicobacter pylori GAM96Ai]